MTNLQYIRYRFVKYMRRTYKTKLTVIGLIALGYIGAVLTGDGTAFVLFLALGIPAFFMN